uniref:Uncharacterized protein n=1 Tax=Lactuca sativa TaxID=4236 RepID=A0A9R1XRE1_LACSA|nr:hypothetical protein LSAT_V11C300143190 [Lactuca sativa]
MVTVLFRIKLLVSKSQTVFAAFLNLFEYEIKPVFIFDLIVYVSFLGLLEYNVAEIILMGLDTSITLHRTQFQLGNGGLFGASDIQVKDFPSLILMFGNNLVERTYESDINGNKFNTRVHTIRC